MCVSHKEFKFKDFDTFLKVFLIPSGSNNYLLSVLSYQYTHFAVSVMFRNQTFIKFTVPFVHVN